MRRSTASAVALLSLTAYACLPGFDDPPVFVPPEEFVPERAPLRLVQQP